MTAAIHLLDKATAKTQCGRSLKGNVRAASPAESYKVTCQSCWRSVLAASRKPGVARLAADVVR
jgi:hypothetical protein